MSGFPSYAVPLIEGYGERPEPAVERTEMESGPPKQMRVRSRALVTRPVKYLLASQADYAAFMAWFRDTLGAGADWFDWTDPRDGVTKKARIVGGKLDARPTVKTLARWIVSFELETWG